MLNFRLGLSGARRTQLDGELVEARRTGDLPRTNRVSSILALAERARLTGSPFLRSCGRCVAKQSAKIFRLLNRFHIFGLIAKVPRTRRWRLTNKGWALLSAAISLKEQTFPLVYAQTCE